MRASRPLIVLVVGALLCGLPLADRARPAAEAQGAPSPAAPYRVGYISNEATRLVRPGPEGPVPAAPGGSEGTDSDASAGGDPATGCAGLVWVSRRPATPGGAEQDGDLWYLRDGTATPQRLTGDDAADAQPALSPDGQWVAFASDRSGTRHIWAIRVDGTGLHQVTDGPGADTWPTWSPDGTRLAFGSTRDDPAGDIYTVPAGGGAASRITRDPAADSQPAWSPDGTRIAFTTTRFRPAGDVALTPAGGGPVSRAVPGDADSAEPAWSPDGTRIAFSTRRADPHGDVSVVTVADGTVTTVAADPRAGETHPTWRRTGNPAAATTDVVYTQTYRDGTSDVWSADAGGQDRHDRTNRPGFDETDPAYSPDGAQLAYTRYDGLGGRVMVSDADGRHPRPLSPALPAGESERDPAWSPDGTRIALTHVRQEGEGSRAWVRIVGVSDGRVLGDLPMPAHLAGNDVQPAWSPDGSRIALARTANRVPQQPSFVDPPVVDRPAAVGTSFTVDKTVHTPSVPADPDVVLLIDDTGSMSGPIGGVRQDMHRVIDEVRARQPAARFGVAAYQDEANGPRVFRVEQPPVPADTPAQRALLDAALARLTAQGGNGDLPEDWINALFRVGTGAIDFRPNSSKIVVLVGDASSHDPSVGHTPQDAITALSNQHIRVVGVPVSSYADGLDTKHQAARVAQDTHGVLLPLTSDPTKVADAIIAGITSLPVTVAPVATACDAGLSVAFAPSGSTEVAGGADARFVETARLAADVPVGATLHCTVEFRLNGEQAVRPGYAERISVRATDPALPTVIVDDATANATGPDGAAVTYSASAVDATGRPLTPTCSPRSGSTFPVGVTTVTCTATDAAGRTGSDTAQVAVVDPNAGPVERLWVVGLRPSDPDGVTFTDQADLSARIGQPCAGGADSAPDWSPDGRSLVFQHGGMICVVDAAGGNARSVVQDAGRTASYRDPAFSPDGTLIAFGDNPGDGGVPRIWTVPAGGGRPAVLIDSAGGACQPAFQRQPRLTLTAAAVPASIPFGGRTTVLLQVTNRGIAPAPATEVRALLPDGLRREQISASRGDCVLAELRCALGTLAPGESATVQMVATGVTEGDQAVYATVHSALRDVPEAEARTTVGVGRAAGPPGAGGSLSLTVTAGPTPGYVGGDTVVVVYTVRNGTAVAAPSVRLGTSLPAGLPVVATERGMPPGALSPAGCAATAGGCDLGMVPPGQSVEVRIGLAPAAAVSGTASGTVTSSGPDDDPKDNTAAAPVVVRQPTLDLDPGIGPPGFVARVLGRDFPPGGVVRLAWSVGISEIPGEVTVRPDGTIDAQALVFHKDLLGPRTLLGSWVRGSRFGTVASVRQFLVVPRTVQPPAFVAR